LDGQQEIHKENKMPTGNPFQDQVIKVLGADWDTLANEDKNNLREEWIVRQLMATDNPRNQEYLKRFTEEAYADVTPPSTEGAFFPPLREYPGRMLRQAVRMFTTPQQFLQSAFRQPSDRPITERVISPFKEAGEYALGGEEKYPYSLYTDPMVIAGIPTLIKSGAGILARRLPTAIKAGQSAVKKGAKVAERVRPPSGLPKGEIPGNVPPLSTVEPQFMGKVFPRPLTPPPAGIYRQAMGKLTPHFVKDEAQKVAQFVAQHPDDLISQAVKSKGPLNPEMVEQIRSRILAPVEFPSAARMARTPGSIKPPPVREKMVGGQSPESIIEQINNIDPTKPSAFSEYLKIYGGI